MNELTEHEKDRLFATLDKQTAQLANLERGMYGDPANKVKGIVDEVADIKRWIEKSKRKIAWIAGFGTAIGLLLNKVWEWIVSHTTNNPP
jgi:hypothetical protein